MASKNYLSNEYVSDAVYQYMKFRKKEKELVNIIRSIVIHLQLMPKFSGYSKDVLDDMLQVSYFNFFNNIHDIKFSKKKIGSIIKIKSDTFFKQYDAENNIRPLAGKKLLCYNISGDNKKLICFETINIFDNNDKETLEKCKIICSDNKSLRYLVVKSRINAYEFKEYYTIYNIDNSYEVEYDNIDFNFFSFITGTIKSSFFQVLNKENEYKEGNQVVLWEKSDAYKFDINNIEIQTKIANKIKTANELYQKKRSR